MKQNKQTLALAFVLGLWATAPRLQAQGDLAERVERLEGDNAELRHRVDVLTDELQHVDLGDVFDPVGEGAHGLSPGASKVYAADDGLSLGGYGEALYRNFAGSGTDQFDLLRVVLYMGYKFAENWVFNSEIEFEHANTENGEVAVEFAYLDWLLDETVNLRGGLVLVPMGLINELHEPTVYLGATRPETERRILPSTWRENGVGAFGDVGPVSYRAYVLTGFNADGFDATGLRGGRQEGSEAVAEDMAVVGRVDWTATPGLLAGASLYHGDSEQDNAGFEDTAVTIYEAHVDFRARGWRFRALGAMANVDDVAELNAAKGLVGTQSVGEELQGGYVELGYDVLDLFAPESDVSVTPYARFETIDTQADVPSGFMSDPDNDGEIASIGVQVQPIPQLVFKLDYQDWEDDNDRVNLLFGYVY